MGQRRKRAFDQRAHAPRPEPTVSPLQRDPRNRSESAAFSAVASSAAFIFFRSTVILSIFPVHLLSPFS